MLRRSQYVESAPPGGSPDPHPSLRLAIAINPCCNTRLKPTCRDLRAAGTSLAIRWSRGRMNGGQPGVVNPGSLTSSEGIGDRSINLTPPAMIGQYGVPGIQTYRRVVSETGQ